MLKFEQQLSQLPMVWCSTVTLSFILSINVPSQFSWPLYKRPICNSHADLQYLAIGILQNITYMRCEEMNWLFRMVY